MTVSRLLNLAGDIQTQVSKIHQHLSKSGQTDPSFDGKAPATNFDGIDDLRASVLNNLTELHDLLCTPRELLQDKAPTDLVSRHALDRLGVYDSIPVGETRTYAQISEGMKYPVGTIRRIMRHAMTQRIFYEPQPDTVAHTQVSRLLAEDKHVRDYYGMVCQEVWPAATRVVDALENWPESQEREDSGYFLATGKSFQQMLDENLSMHKRYDNAMGAFVGDRAFSPDHVIRGYDWASLGKATVVDVGGGIGTVSKLLAKAYPELTFIVEDQEAVIANAIVEDSNIEGRIRFLEHDFFTEQPIKGADAYFLSKVFIEWPDDKAVLILRALLPALKKGALVLIQDVNIPEPGTDSIWLERRYRSSDLLALAIENAAPRQLENWQKLFELAGPGYQFKGVTTVLRTNVIFIEAIADGSSFGD